MPPTSYNLTRQPGSRPARPQGGVHHTLGVEWRLDGRAIDPLLRREIFATPRRRFKSDFGLKGFWLVGSGSYTGKPNGGAPPPLQQCSALRKLHAGGPEHNHQQPRLLRVVGLNTGLCLFCFHLTLPWQGGTPAILFSAFVLRD